MERVKDLSRNRMNVLWLHFSENEGFRIDSERHPEVPSRFHLTKDEVREIIALCGDLFVDINPALDCPGHLGTALLEHPRWRLNRQMTEPLYSALDITNPEARAFLLELVDEYAELFAGSKVFHIGGDEFIDFNHFELFPEMEACAKERLGPGCGGVDLYVDFLTGEGMGGEHSGGPLLHDPVGIGVLVVLPDEQDEVEVAGFLCIQTDTLLFIL